MNEYFSMNDKVYDVTERYPQLIDLFAAKGFTNLKNEAMRKTIGKTISIELALKSKNIDAEFFEREMIELIKNKKLDHLYISFSKSYDQNYLEYARREIGRASCRERV